jgi:putative Mg2+ transporter-C (MgtC) family protein
MLTANELIVRIAIGALLGGVIGFERDLHGRNAGLRTHLIVALAAATFMVISAHFYGYQHYLESEHPLEADVSRIAASVVSAVGFLAGGAILKTGATIQGLTTAAGLWLVTAIGMAAGAGMFSIAVAATLMGLVALTVLRLFEDKEDHFVTRSLQVELKGGPAALDQFTLKLKDLGAKVKGITYDHQIAAQYVKLEYMLKLPEKQPDSELVRVIESHPEVMRFRIGIPE